MQNPNNVEKRSNFINRSLNLKKLEFRDIVIGIPIICYIFGFLITNLYLGSIGVVNLDILRVRYIIAGLLFLAFLSFVFIPLIGLSRTLKKNRGKPISFQLFEVTWYSMLVFGLLNYVVVIFNAFTGRPRSQSGNFLAVPLAPFYNLLEESIQNVLDLTLRIGYLIVIFFFLFIPLITLIIVIFNPKDKHGINKSRSEILKDIYRQFLSFKNIFYYLVFLFVAIVFVFLVVLLVNIGNSDIFSNFLTNESNSPGWSIYLYSSFIIYMASGIALTARDLIASTNADRAPRISSFMDLSLAFLLLATFYVSIIVPTYALVVYPSIPQQLGGGKVVSVHVLTSNEELGPFFLSSENDTFLIDRTNSSSLFLIVNQCNLEQSIIEVSNSQIDSITYLREPTSLAGEQSE